MDKSRTYKGVDINELTKEELLEVLNLYCNSIDEIEDRLKKHIEVMNGIIRLYQRTDG